MSTALIGAIVAIAAIEADKLTQFKHAGLPLVAMAGLSALLFSLLA